jgi:uncharacterized protein YlzI (FlbEa/FlbD family)
LIGLTLDKVYAEELPTQMTAIPGVQESSLYAMINNTLLGKINSNSPDSTITGNNGEEYQVIHSYENSHSQLSAMINNALLGKVNSNSPDSTITGNNGEEYQVIHSYENSHSQLSAMINNALLGNVNSNSPDAAPSEYVIEQFITIKPDGYNDNIIFEPQKKVEVLNSNVPFILPVPFP